MQDAMERINLNVPRDVRKRLRAMATRSGRTEAEVARTLLVGALTRAEREEIYRRFAKCYTPEMRARDLARLRAFERLDG
jgi:plasmid stability protein